MLSSKLEKDLKDIIGACVKALSREGAVADTSLAEDPPEIELESPRDKSHGDLATNIALRISKYAGKAPLEYAALLAKKINNELSRSALKTELEKAEVRPPGFINFRFSRSRVFEVLGCIARDKARYGSINLGKRQKVNIEFVSANPTGPLTIAHGRQAAFGDTLANILQAAGYRVTREYYLNDEGNQISLLARSVKARYMEAFGMKGEFPDDGYKGLYINGIAADIKKKYGSKFIGEKYMEFFSDFCCKWMTENIKSDLSDFNVDFDVWYSQKKLNRSGKIKSALRLLSRKQLLYKKNGAIWFKASRFGDDKDRVVVKSNGEYTYLAPDIAYHIDKFKRGFDRLIDIWGPDHHGYIPRIMAVVSALGHKKEALKTLIIQLSTLYKDGNVIRMSTRAGEFITLKDLIGEVGKNVARFFFLRRKRDSHLDFDLSLAKKHSMDNPVYYIQYAHARICSTVKFRAHAGRTPAKASVNITHLKEDTELDIIKLLGRFPSIIGLCAEKLEVFPLISYLEETASAFHSYYDKYRIVTADVRLTESRIFLCLAIRTVLANGLRMLGVASPESM